MHLEIFCEDAVIKLMLAYATLLASSRIYVATSLTCKVTKIAARLVMSHCGAISAWSGGAGVDVVVAVSRPSAVLYRLQFNDSRLSDTAAARQCRYLTYCLLRWVRSIVVWGRIDRTCSDGGNVRGL